MADEKTVSAMELSLTEGGVSSRILERGLHLTRGGGFHLNSLSRDGVCFCRKGQKFRTTQPAPASLSRLCRAPRNSQAMTLRWSMSRLSLAEKYAI